jgi:hypothetical protein
VLTSFNHMTSQERKVWSEVEFCDKPLLVTRKQMKLQKIQLWTAAHCAALPFAAAADSCYLLTIVRPGLLLTFILFSREGE